MGNGGSKGGCCSRGLISPEDVESTSACILVGVDSGFVNLLFELGGLGPGRDACIRIGVDSGVVNLLGEVGGVGWGA